jgi:hypothetical protein
VSVVVSRLRRLGVSPHPRGASAPSARVQFNFLSAIAAFTTPSISLYERSTAPPRDCLMTKFFAELDDVDRTERRLSLSPSSSPPLSSVGDTNPRALQETKDVDRSVSQVAEIALIAQSSLW